MGDNLTRPNKLQGAVWESSIQGMLLATISNHLWLLMNSQCFQHHQIIFVQDPEVTLGLLGIPFPACP